MSVKARKHRLGLLLVEQRQMIIAEYCEKIGHHELQAARAEEERRILREESWRQQKWNFVKLLNKVLQRWRNYGNSRVLLSIRSQDGNSSRIRQELQNEVNCMSDSKDFQDAESVRSGNSHVTSRPVSFPPHPIPEGMSRHSFITPSRREGPPSIRDTHGISGNVFATPDASSQHPILKNCVNGIRQSKSRSIRSQWRKVKDQNKINI